MKNYSIIIVALMVSYATAVYANNETGTVVSQNRNQNAFYGLVLASDMNVVLSQGTTQSVIVEALPSDLSYINTKVINGSLVVSLRNNHKLNGPATVHVTMNEIDLIEVLGNGQVNGKVMINADVLTLKVKGNGSIRVDVRALSVGMNLSGCGSINISGSAANSLIKIYGQGHVFTGGFNSFNTVEMIDDTPVDCTAMLTEKME